MASRLSQALPGSSGEYRLSMGANEALHIATVTCLCLRISRDSGAFRTMLDKALCQICLLRLARRSIRFRLNVSHSCVVPASSPSPQLQAHIPATQRLFRSEEHTSE